MDNSSIEISAKEMTDQLLAKVRSSSRPKKVVDNFKKKKPGKFPWFLGVYGVIAVVCVVVIHFTLKS